MGSSSSGNAALFKSVVVCIVLLSTIKRAQGGIGSDTINAVLNKPDLKVPLSQIASTQYLERIAQAYYLESDTVSGAEPGLEPTAVYDMLVAQQRWRRGAEPQDKYIGKAYDCQPTYKISKSATKWFHTRVYEVGLCFTACSGYPHCTQTTPLVGTQDTGLSLLMRCGVRAMDRSQPGSGWQEVTLVAKDAANNARPICRSVVDRGVELPGVTVQSTNLIRPLPVTNDEIQVKAFKRTAQPHQGELAYFTHDLWSHWKSSILGVGQVNTTRAGAKQAILAAGVYKNDNSDYKGFIQAGGNITELTVNTTQMTLDAFWLITWSGKDFLLATYVFFRPDLDSNWYTFITYGAGNSGGTYGSGGTARYYDVNGACQNTISSLWDTAAAWNHSFLLDPADPGVCQYLNISNVSTVDDVGGSWANAGTLLYRPQDRQHNRCPIVLNTWQQSQASNAVYGCPGSDGNPQPAFIFNSFGSGCCQGDHLITYPALETRLFSGASPSTYEEAWEYHTAMQALPAAQRDLLYIDSNTSGFKPKLGSSGAANIPEYYILVNASLAWNESDLQRLQLVSLQAAQQRLAYEDMDSFDDGATIVAFTTLLITVLTIPTHWSTELQQKLLGYFGKWCSKYSSHVWARVAYIGLVRFLASAVVVGPGIFSFVTVVAQGTGTSISDGFPTINFASSTPQPCQNTRIGDPGLGTIETALVITTVQTWAVVLVCVLSVMAILVATVLAMRNVATQPTLALPSVVKP